MAWSIRAGQRSTPASSVPGPSNTGPEAAGYTLTDWVGSSIFTTPGQVIEGKRFLEGATVDADDVEFLGCEFRSTNPEQFVLRLNAARAVADDCRWRPDATDSVPVSLADSYQQGIKMFSGAVGLTSRRGEWWGFGNAVEFEPTCATEANPILLEDFWMHDAADQAHAVYHHDGVLCSDGAEWVTLRGGRIGSVGNTNAVALQSIGTPVSHIVLDGLQLSGFGYTVNLGDDAGGSDCTVINCVLLDDFVPDFGPFKNNWPDFTGTNAWANNRRADGGYWWPTDGTSTPSHETDWAG